MSRSFPIRQVTVYTDITASSLLSIIESCARRVCPDNVKVITASMLMQGSTHKQTDSTAVKLYSPSSLVFMKEWEREQADVYEMVNSQIPLMNKFECFITAAQDIRHGEVAYALYRRCMPVLSLCVDSSSDVNVTNSTREGKTGLERVLYECREPTAEAIETFLTFPEKSGCILAVESDNFSLKKEGADTSSSGVGVMRRACANAIAQLQKESCGFVVGLGRDGYPLSTNTSAQGQQHRELPTPGGRFDELLSRLMKPSSASSFATDEANNFHDLMRHNPTIFGALSAFNRYDNSGVLRYLVQRGHPVVVLDWMSSTAHEVYHALMGVEGEDPTKCAAAKFTKHMQTLGEFEGHWLEMPKPSKSLCVTTRPPEDNWTGCMPRASNAECELDWAWLDAMADSGDEALLTDRVYNALKKMISK